MRAADNLDPRAASDAAWEERRQAEAAPNGSDLGEPPSGQRTNHSPRPRGLQLVHWRDMCARLDGRPLVKGLVQRGQISLLVGESGSGKTFLVLDLALHVAAGMDWFGRRVTSGPVIYVAAEAGASITNRVVAWRDSHGLADRDIPFAAITSPLDLCHTSGGDLDRLISAIPSAGLSAPELVIIDTVSRALAGGNENAPDDMGALVLSLDRLRNELGCHVCAVHHVGKEAARGSRGHSLLHCAVDTEIVIARNAGSGLSTATITKQRESVAGGQIAFRLLPVELGLDADGDSVTSCVIDPAEAAPAGKAARRAKVLPDSARIALDTLRKTISEAGEPAPSSNHVPTAAHVVSVETWRRYHYCGTASDEQTAEARKKAFQRVRDQLQAAGIIGLHADQVWIVADA